MMATPSSHNGTPPKTLPLTNRKQSNGFFQSSIPLASIPYDRRRSSTIVSNLPINAPQQPMTANQEAEEEEFEIVRRRSIAAENVEKLLLTGENRDLVEDQKSPLLERRAHLLESQFKGQSFNSEEEDPAEVVRMDSQSNYHHCCLLCYQH